MTLPVFAQPLLLAIFLIAMTVGCLFCRSVMKKGREAAAATASNNSNEETITHNNSDSQDVVVN